ncbi:MAG: 50S ribosomal protein L9 [Acidobacteriota bacterium]
MQIILLKDTRHLGKRGEQVNVKPGFARNYLLPQGFALEATPGNVAFFQQQRTRIDAEHAREREAAAQVAAEIAALRIEIAKRAGESETLYGSVTTSEIAEALDEKGVKVDRRRIEVSSNTNVIKSLGEHTVSIDLHPEVVAELTVVVVPAG